MLRLIKYLKPFILSVLAIVIFLFVQAYCDLSLPDYTSKIVNVGIQQKGIENAIPKVIRKRELEKLKLFMNQSDKSKVDKSYKLLSKQNLSTSDFKSYVKDYPKLKKESIYKLKDISKEKRDKLNSIMGKSELIVAQIEKNGLSNLNQMSAAAPQASKGKTNPFDVISKLPATSIEAMEKNINSKFSKLPDSMITQAAVSYVNKEYKSIGMNVDNVQTNYILYSGGIMLLLALLSMAATIIVGYIGAKVAGKLSRNLRKDVFQTQSLISSQLHL
jgi:ATP-binding cassette subfamily B multidrug efflux pump